MGEVYRARDTKLDRDVAIKVLPAAFGSDPDRIARFQREAKTLAALNHPNIAAIYGLEERDGATALVLELVEGPTLADRIAQSPGPLRDALPVATQIAAALEAAHERGIVHRDLKPSNIKLRPDGTVKVLDFGLAKRPSGIDADDVAADDITWSRADARRRDSRNRRVHVPRAGRRQARQFCLGSVFVWRDPLRVVDRAASVPAGHIGRDAFCDHPRRAALDPGDQPGCPDRVAAGRRALPEEETGAIATPIRDSSRSRCVDIRDSWDGGAASYAGWPSTERLSRPPRRSPDHAAASRDAARCWLAGVGDRVGGRRPRPGGCGRSTPEFASWPSCRLPMSPTTRTSSTCSDGITESLIQQISRLPSLTVMARSTVFNFKNKPIDPREVGRQLGVDAILTGTVSLRSGRLKITAELVEVATGVRLWGNTYDRAATEVVSVQDEIANAIIDDGIRLTAER